MDKEFNLKEEIKNLGMTQKEFAKHIDKNVHTITRWIKQDIPLPTIVVLYIEAYKKAILFDKLSVKF